MSAAFHLIVSDVAARDIETILEWTVENFGLDAELRYRRLITQALRDIEEEPNRLESRRLPGLPSATLSYHLYFSRERARSELGWVRRPRHSVLYQVRGPVVVVLRLLHDEQDRSRKIRDLG